MLLYITYRMTHLTLYYFCCGFLSDFCCSIFSHYHHQQKYLHRVFCSSAVDTSQVDEPFLFCLCICAHLHFRKMVFIIWFQNRFISAVNDFLRSGKMKDVGESYHRIGFSLLYCSLFRTSSKAWNSKLVIKPTIVISYCKT